MMYGLGRIIEMTKGQEAYEYRKMYKSRQYGLTWMSIAKNYNQTIAAVQRCAYKWARRYGKQWPPR